MSTKVKIIIAILILTVFAESWLISKLWNVENQVIPASSLMYTDLKDSSFEDTLVTLTGSWYSKTKLAFPTQSSEIQCWKDKATCFEAQGSISDNYLHTALLSYTIKFWNDKEIVAEYDALCKTTELKINREEKQATLTSTTKSSVKDCSSYSQEPLLLYLTDGYNAWSKNKESK